MPILTFFIYILYQFPCCFVILHRFYPKGPLCFTFSFVSVHTHLSFIFMYRKGINIAKHLSCIVICCCLWSWSTFMTDCNNKKITALGFCLVLWSLRHWWTRGATSAEACRCCGPVSCVQRRTWHVSDVMMFCVLISFLSHPSHVFLLFSPYTSGTTCLCVMVMFHWLNVSNNSKQTSVNACTSHVQWPQYRFWCFSSTVTQVNS